MFSARMTTRLASALAGSLPFLAPVNSIAAPTTVDELVAYGAAHETNELFRYDFGSDTFKTIGVVKDQFNQVVNELYCLGYIPYGPNKGIYGTPDGGGSKGYVVKVDPITAAGTRLPNKMGAAWSRIDGMTSYMVGTDWYLLGSANNKDLVRIDPATGLATKLRTLSQVYGGFARASDGLLYGVKGKDLYEINMTTGTEVKKGAGKFDKIEALEFAFGMDEPKVECMGLSDQWVGRGLLMGFSENKALVIFNPATGDSMQYPCGMPIKDYEGLVFIPENADGWGQITTNAHD